MGVGGISAVGMRVLVHRGCEGFSAPWILVYGGCEGFSAQWILVYGGCEGFSAQWVWGA